MTLLALLRTVAYAWRQDALAANAQAVLTLGKELHGRLATMGRTSPGWAAPSTPPPARTTRRSSSLETRVLVSARRFADLHVVDGDLPTPAPVEPAAVRGQRARAGGVGRRADRRVRRPRRPRRARAARRARADPDAATAGRSRRVAPTRRRARTLRSRRARRTRLTPAWSTLRRVRRAGRPATAAVAARAPGPARGLEVGAQLARQGEHQVLGRGADLLDVAEAVLGEQREHVSHQDLRHRGARRHADRGRRRRARPGRSRTARSTR